MKPEQIFEAFNELDEEKLAHSETNIRRFNRISRFSTLAACACVAIVLISVVPSMHMHKSSSAPAEGYAGANDMVAGTKDVMEEAAHSEEDAIIGNDQEEAVLTALPAYAYTGDDAVVAAIVDYTADTTLEAAKGDVWIPSFVIFKSEQTKDGQTAVYGNYWSFTYHQEGSTLVCDSGSEMPGVMYLKADGDGFTVEFFDGVGDGSEYVKDIKRICGRDKKLQNQYLNAVDADKDPVLSQRNAFIKEYVESNQLDVDAYQDYGWDPVTIK